MHNCVQNTSTLANFSDIGDTSNELLPSFSDSGLESVGTPSENININSSDHMYETYLLNSEYIPPVDDSSNNSDNESVQFRVGRVRTRGAVARGRGLRTCGGSSVRGRTS